MAVCKGGISVWLYVRVDGINAWLCVRAELKYGCMEGLN